MSKINRYTRAMRQMRSTRLDEAVPTMSMQGIYVDTPFVVTTPPEEVIQGQGADYTQDDSGGDTSGLFDANGDQLTAVPPVTIASPDNSYILGPMASMWYSWGNFSTIGYIREADRKMVNLASITGPLHTWDKTSGFNSYGQLTLEQAKWFVDNPKYGGVDNNYANANYRAYYPGPPSSSTDSEGRYLCTITGVPKQLPSKYQPPDDFTPGTNVSADDEKSPLKNIVPGSANPDKDKKKKGLLDRVKDIASDLWGDTKEKAEDLWDYTKNDLDKRWDRLSKGVGDFVTDIFDADNAADYNAKLAVNLGLSIISGKGIDIPLSKSAQKDLVNNIDANALADALTYNKSTPTTGEEAVNPSGNKTDQVVKGTWGAQGGLNFNYNEKTNELEIVSNKTLRTTSGGESIVKKKYGKNFEVDHLTDIPEPSTEKVQDMATKLISKISGKLGLPSLDLGSGKWTPEQEADMLKTMQDTYNSNQISKATTEIASDIMTQSTQGVAQTAIQIRKALQQLEITSSTDAKGSGWKPFEGQSDVEKVGGAYGHVTSTTKVPYDQLPPEIQKVVKGSKNKKEHYYAPKTRKLLREVKQPYVMPEEKKVKLTGYKPKLPNKDKMRQLADSMNVPEKVTFAKAETGTWKAGELERGRKSSQGKKNEVLELLGQGEDSWVYMTETSRKKSGKAMYENFTLMNEQGQGTYKISRKEPLRSDYVLFLEYQDGTKSTMLQSELNEKMSDQSEKWRKDWKEPIKYEDQPAFKKVKKILNKEIPLKDIQPEFPKKAPPKLDPETQMHPDMFKRHDYFTKLDPDSAKTMAAAPTGDPKIDAEVEKAKKKSK